MNRTLSIVCSLSIPLVMFLVTGSAAADTNRVLDQAGLFLTSQPPTSFERCGTIRLLNLLRGEGANKPSAFASVYMTLDRPSSQRYADSAEGHFRVHYEASGYNAPSNTDGDMNGIPDFVDSTLVYLEYAWQNLLGLGYGKPKSDAGRGGSDAVDVYIQELSNQQIYGYVSPDESRLTMSSSYMVIDNNFKENVYPTKGMDALRVTTAHEFFHMLHYSYYSGDNAAWWMEHSAVWFEDHVWDDVNDYLLYIGSFLSGRDTPLDTGGNFSYSASLFAFMIAKKYGNDIIRTIWNTFRDRQDGRIDLLNSILPEGNTQTVNNLGLWCYFTGSRANSQKFFTDSPFMTGMVTASDTIRAIPSTDSLSLNRYTFKYVDLTLASGFSPVDSLQFNFTERNGGLWKRSVIMYNSATDFETMSLAGSRPLLVFPRSFKKVVLVVANTSTESPQGGYRLVYSVSRPSGNMDAPESFTIAANYPNPFNKETVIRFTVPKTSRVKLRILNIGGQTVDVLTDGVWEPGTHTLTYTPSHLASGVYFAVLESGGSFVARKMAFVK